MCLMRIAAYITLFTTALAPAALADIIHVPDEQPTIQAGIDAAQDGDTVLVAPGTYTGDGNRDISFFGKRITLRSSQGPLATTIDSEGSPTELHSGFRILHNERRETIVDGFTITGGYQFGDTGGFNGGGGGSGIFIQRSSPTIRNCVIRGNHAAAFSGGGLQGNGAGIYVDEASFSLIENCIITDNHAERRGGGISIVLLPYIEARVVIRNCLIARNQGGGLHVGFASVDVINTTIVQNELPYRGSGIRGENAEVFLSSSIVWANRELAQIYTTGIEPAIQYSAIEGGRDALDGDVTDTAWGVGSIAEDPRFEPGDTYRLSSRSPCLDAGDPVYIGPETDPFRHPRILNYRVDMGANEAPHSGMRDCNGNETPDSIEIGSGKAQDCNYNGAPDACDLANGRSEDSDGDDVPDECPVYILIASMPPDGAVDARQPTEPDGTGHYGWNRIEFVFYAEMPTLATSDFEVLVSGGETPVIDGVEIDGRFVTVTLDRSITPGECTTVGLVDSDARVSLRYEPGKAASWSGSTTANLLGMIDHLNDQYFPPMEIWQCDINRSGACEPSDLLRLIDVLMGAESFERWVLVPTPQCPN